MTSTLQRYIETGKSIAKVRSTSLLYEISKLLLYRVVTGYGPEHYTTYSLYNEPVNVNRWRQYLDKRDFCRLLFRYNKKENFRVLEDKVAFASDCLRFGLPHPEIDFTCNYTGENSPFKNFDSTDMAEGFADLALGEYIVKTCDGSYGVNLWSIVKTTDYIQVHNIDKKIPPEQFAALLVDSKESYLVQRKIEVAPALRDIMPGLACGSMRIGTFLSPEGTVSIPACFVKLPVIGAISDNFADGASGNLIATINMENFTIQKVLRKAADGLYKMVTQHPDTGVDLLNYPLSEVQAALELGRRCALAFPNIPAVGWDIVVTGRGAMVLEGNPMFDPLGPQLCAGSGVRDIIPALLNDTSGRGI